MAHTHPCDNCETETECPGTFDSDYEWPSVVCDVYHTRREGHLCEECDSRQQEAIRGEARADNDR